MRLKPEQKKKNPFAKNKILSFKVGEEDLEHLQVIRNQYPDFSDGKILRTVLKAVAEDVLKKSTR